MNCLHLFRTKNKLSILPSEDIKILEFNQYQKSDKHRSLFYADLECLIEKIDGCKNNPENSCTTKVGVYVRSGFLMSTISSFKSIENKYNACRGKVCMKKICEFLRDHAMNIINFKHKKNEVTSKRNAGIA